MTDDELKTLVLDEVNHGIDLANEEINKLGAHAYHVDVCRLTRHSMQNKVEKESE